MLVTGGSSGIGMAAACKFAEAGASRSICARDEDKLAEAKQRDPRQGRQGARRDLLGRHRRRGELQGAGRRGSIEEHGGVDFLINNAGRSIRRAIEASYDRFHDFERTMQLNYFGCLRVIMGFLPGMVAKKQGHIVNICSIGVLTNAPRFSAYVASKAALDALTRCAVERVRRHRHHLHDDQHAAGAHADDRADQDVRQRADARRPRKRPT